jgi:DNA-binding MarR family transcriptional regulator
VDTRTNAKSRSSLPLLPCACSNLRRAARAVTRLYNQELRSDGIEITQFTLLMALDLTGETSQGKLGELLALDSTTLTRMLELLKKRGWVRSKEGDDRRVRIFRLTTAGREKLQQSMRHWKRAQDRLQTALGEKVMGQLGGLLAEIAAISVDA